MLIEFTVGNYRSFKDPVTFSMVAANIKSKNQALDQDNVFQIEQQPRLLTSAALYGANASGKSNLVAALNFMRRFVLNSVVNTQRIGGIAAEPYSLSSETVTQPSYFEIVFVVDGKRYRYGFESSAERVEAEWLYFVPSSREAKLFERELDQISVGEKYFREGRDLEDKTRPNALFLTVVAQFDGQVAQTVMAWFRRLTIAFYLEDDTLRLDTVEKLLSGKQSDAIRSFVQRLDLGIEDMQVMPNANSERLTGHVTVPTSTQRRRAVAMQHSTTYFQEEEDVAIETTHRVYDKDGKFERYTTFDLDVHESAGTQKLVSLAGPLVDTLIRGEVLVIDELDARLHPLLTREIVKLFNNPITNPQHAQLIFTTHDTNLLDNQLLRRDQIWFVEKDRRGASDLYSLAEFKVRNDKAYERGYIQGRYGAIPYLGNFQMLIGESDAA